METKYMGMATLVSSSHQTTNMRSNGIETTAIVYETNQCIACQLLMMIVLWYIMQDGATVS